MRTPIALLATLVLATALAAGAGDDIKWENSDDIPYVDIAGDGSDASASYDDEVEKYSVEWVPVTGDNEIDFISATYYGWGLHCTRLRKAVADGKFTESGFFYEIERSKDIFRNFIIFYVTISSYKQPYTNLNNPRRWEIYLESGDEKKPPVLTEQDENAPTHALIIRKYEDIERNYRTYTGNIVTRYAVGHWYRNTYKIAFANAYGEPPRENLRLVMSSKKACRGFEWRFMEECTKGEERCGSPLR